MTWSCIFVYEYTYYISWRTTASYSIQHFVLGKPLQDPLPHQDFPRTPELWNPKMVTDLKSSWPGGFFFRKRDKNHEERQASPKLPSLTLSVRTWKRCDWNTIVSCWDGWGFLHLRFRNFLQDFYHRLLPCVEWSRQSSWGMIFAI